MRHVGLLLFAVWLNIFSWAQTTPPVPEIEHPLTIAARAAAAKAEGRTSVTFPSAGVSYPAVPNGLTKAVGEFTVLVGTPVATQTVIENDTALSTWHSIKVQETLSDRPCKMCALLTTEDLPGTLRPTQLLPVAPQTVLLIRRGGSTNLDGVQVTETENGEATLTIGKKYLFVVDKSPKQVARLVLNDAGIFAVGDDGESLTPLSPPKAKTGAYPTLQQLRQKAASSGK